MALVIVLTYNPAAYAGTSSIYERDNVILGYRSGNSSSFNTRFQQQHRNAARIGFVYSFKFGGKKTNQNKYGTLNFKNFVGRNVPIMDFGVKEISLSSNLKKLSYSDSEITWVLTGSVIVGIVGSLLLLKKEDKIF